MKIFFLFILTSFLFPLNDSHGETKREQIFEDNRSIVLIVGKLERVKWKEDIFSKEGRWVGAFFEVHLKSVEVILGELEKKEVFLILEARQKSNFEEIEKLFVLMDLADEENPEILHYDEVGSSICIGERIVEELNLEPWLGQFDYVARMKCLLM